MNFNILLFVFHCVTNIFNLYIYDSDFFVCEINEVELHSSSDINECHEGLDMCHLNSTCVNTIGSYNCYCLNGFTGDGFNCTSKLYT